MKARVPACRATGLSLLPYFPLAYGLLTGKYKRDQEAPTGSRLSAEGQRRRLQNADFDRIDALQAFADERGIDLLTLAVSGLLAQSGVGSVIAGVSRPDQVARNVAAASWRPTRNDLEELAPINRDPLPGMTHRTYARR